MKILLVEDELPIQRVLSKLMEKRGAEVDKVASGEEAIKLIFENNYAKIICDIQLQDINGFDIIEEAKKKYSSGQIQEKFIIITAYSSAHVLEKASSYGCLLLAKPFDDVHQAIDIFLK